MASPPITRQTDQTSTGTASITVTLPTCAAGDVLLLAVAARNSGNNFRMSGTTSGKAFTTLTVGGSAACDGGAFYRICDGTEGGDTVTITRSSGPSTANWVVTPFIITGSDGTVEYASLVRSSAVTSWPGQALTPSGGADDYLFVALCMNSDASSVSVWPSGYSDPYTAKSGTGTAHATVDSAYKQTTGATSETPGTTTMNSAASGLQLTVSFAPTAGGGTPLPVLLHSHRQQGIL